jgi:hypothetical protein
VSGDLIYSNLQSGGRIPEEKAIIEAVGKRLR